ncbi:MAG: DUF6510 family protein [Sphingomonas sp.]|jgi:hypothetical protein|uniref:DUF6510 family protein n=1 Tax=Sphingomonas sp. TaxID=28214 RepID=UPI0035681E2C
MTDDTMVLDGNAAAGALGSLFAFDVTMAIVRCGNCNASGPLAELRFFGSPQAMVLRCRHCDEVNIRLLETGRTINLDLSGAARIEIGRAT